jgi:protein-L-isoaspartate(D-aspartate) O-methyltransferase
MGEVSTWWEQAAVRERGVTRLIVGRKAPGGGFGYRSIADATYALLPGFAKPREFTF